MYHDYFGNHIDHYIKWNVWSIRSGASSSAVFTSNIDRFSY